VAKTSTRSARGASAGTSSPNRTPCSSLRGRWCSSSWWCSPSSPRRTGPTGRTVPGVDELAGSPVLAGNDLPRFEGDTANDPALGTRTPVVTGTDFDGNEVTIGESGPRSC
jgi:hypothetical protein